MSENTNHIEQDALIKNQSEFKWYVIKAISGQEKKVKAYIESELERSNLKQFVPQILIPTEKIIQIRAGKKITKERNYFPGYILIEANLNNGEVKHTIRNTPGVLGFLTETKGGDPISLRPSEINRLLGKVDELTESEGTIETNFSIGESVKIINGPFNGFTGIIEEVNTEKKKLKVTVKIFGRKSPVELNFGEVEKE